MRVGLYLEIWFWPTECGGTSAVFLGKVFLLLEKRRVCFFSSRAWQPPEKGGPSLPGPSVSGQRQDSTERMARRMVEKPGWSLEVCHKELLGCWTSLSKIIKVLSVEPAGNRFLSFAAQSTLMNRVTSFWRLSSPHQLSSTLNFSSKSSPGRLQGVICMCLGTLTRFFFFHPPNGCLFTHKSFKGGSSAWPCCWSLLWQADPWQRHRVLILSMSPSLEVATVPSSLHSEQHQAHIFHADRESLSSSIFAVISLWPRLVSTQISKSCYSSLPHRFNVCRRRVRSPASSRCSAECQTLNHNADYSEPPST